MGNRGMYGFSIGLDLSISILGGTQSVLGNGKNRLVCTATQSIYIITGGYIQILLIGGGGGGGDRVGGGGGAGGLIFTRYKMNAGMYLVTIGDGGAGRSDSSGPGATGANSIFGNLIAYGGGGGGGYNTAATTGGSGGGDNGYAGFGDGAAGVLGQGYAGGNDGGDYCS